jgi:hypothetical protein
VVSVVSVGGEKIVLHWVSVSAVPENEPESPKVLNRPKKDVLPKQFVYECPGWEIVVESGTYSEAVATTSTWTAFLLGCSCATA